MNRKAWYSLVQYRPDPADEKVGVIPLGVLLEFTTSKFWVVGTALSAALPEERLATLDPLSKRVLESRSEVISKEMERVLPTAERPGNALEQLASKNPWSIHISRPKQIKLSAEAGASETSSIEQLLEQYVFEVYLMFHHPETQPGPRGKGAAVPKRALSDPAMMDPMPAAWMLPKAIMRPWLAH